MKVTLSEDFDKIEPNDYKDVPINKYMRWHTIHENKCKTGGFLRRINSENFLFNVGRRYWTVPFLNHVFYVKKDVPKNVDLENGYTKLSEKDYYKAEIKKYMRWHPKNNKQINPGGILEKITKTSFIINVNGTNNKIPFEGNVFHVKNDIVKPPPKNKMNNDRLEMYKFIKTSIINKDVRVIVGKKYITWDQLVDLFMSQ